MSVFGCEVKINGLRCGQVMRGWQNGEYILVFEREFASLEEIEAVPWGSPTIEVVNPLGTVLPVGYGFDLANIAYEYSCHTWKVTLTLGEQYLGDVTQYAEQVEQLQAAVTEAEGAAQQAQAEAEAAAAEAAAAKAEAENAQAEVEAAQEQTQAAQAEAATLSEVINIIVNGEGAEE